MQGNLQTAREIFNCLLAKGLQPDIKTYTIMIKGFCKEGLIDKASELLEKMDGNHFSPDDRTYNTIIQGLLQQNETTKALELVKIMVDKDFSANATIASMVVDLLSANPRDKALQELLHY